MTKQEKQTNLNHVRFESLSNLMESSSFNTSLPGTKVSFIFFFFFNASKKKYFFFRQK